MQKVQTFTCICLFLLMYLSTRDRNEEREIRNSFGVRLKHYEKADGGKAILKNTISLPVSTRKKDQLLQRIANL